MAEADRESQKHWNKHRNLNADTEPAIGRRGILLSNGRSDPVSYYAGPLNTIRAHDPETHRHTG